MRSAKSLAREHVLLNSQVWAEHEEHMINVNEIPFVCQQARHNQLHLSGQILQAQRQRQRKR